MLIPNGDGTATAGPLDIVLIYHNVDKNTFHPAVYVHAPMPGPRPNVNELDIVRLRSQSHHTKGLPTLEEAQEYIRTELLSQLKISEDNIVLDPPYPWDGKLGDTMIVPNWRKKGAERPFRDVVLG